MTQEHRHVASRPTVRRNSYSADALRGIADKLEARGLKAVADHCRERASEKEAQERHRERFQRQVVPTPHSRQNTFGNPQET